VDIVFTIGAEPDNAANMRPGGENKWSGYVTFGNTIIYKTPYAHPSSYSAIQSAQDTFTAVLRKMVGDYLVDTDREDAESSAEAIHKGDS